MHWSFVDIINLGDDSGAKRHSSIKKKIDDYETQIRNEEQDGITLATDLLEQEVHSYLCYAFWTYWTGEDANALQDPHFAVRDIFVRSMVAWAYGRRAIDNVEILLVHLTHELEAMK
jgi:hypothetical protein